MARYIGVWEDGSGELELELGGSGPGVDGSGFNMPGGLLGGVLISCLGRFAGVGLISISSPPESCTCEFLSSSSILEGESRLGRGMDTGEGGFSSRLDGLIVGWVSFLPRKYLSSKSALSAMTASLDCRISILYSLLDIQ